MSALRALKESVYRLHINPAPRTQSESSAILRRLQDFGPVSFFKINKFPETPSSSSQRSRSKFSESSATVVFARDVSDILSLKRDVDGLKFEVVANDNIPDAAVKDPYNVRGIRAQIPPPVARKFRCRITLAQETSSSILTDNEFASGYTVDRRSVLGEILAKTDAPSGMIQGLLPKIDRNYTGQPYGVNSASNYEEWTNETKDAVIQKYSEQGIELRSLKIPSGTSEYQPQKFENGKDEFKMLEDFSLMETYRRATGETKRDSGQTESASIFRPFTIVE